MLDFYNHYIVPPLSAGIATLPLSRAFDIKTALQLGEKCPKFSLIEALKSSSKMGVAIGVQLTSQKALEKHLNETPTVKDIAISSAVVGGISTPFWVVFNGQTMNWTVKKSLERMSFAQGSAIIVREAIFLFSLRVSSPINDQLEQSFGKSKPVEYATCFLTATLGSFLSHPADTIFTLSQGNRKIELSKLMRGSPITALAIGLFSVLNEMSSTVLKVTKQ